MTKPQIKALKILYNNGHPEKWGACDFAHAMWPDSLLLKRIHGAALCGGQYLGKLKKRKLVDEKLSDIGKRWYYIISKLGIEKLKEFEKS